jgi:hypothetical protein
MKTKKHVSFLFLFLFTGLCAVAFAGNWEKTEIRNLKNFDAVKVSSGIDMFLSMGTEESVRIVADDDDYDDVVAEVKGGTLHIYMKRTNWFNFLNWGTRTTPKAYVTVKELKSISASAGSDVKSENTLKGDILEVNVSSGSDVVLNLIYKEISLDASSGSDAKLGGKAKTLSARASSGSDIMARDLETVICHANASSGADIMVHATGEIHAKASSGADIRYYGNPGIKNINESSGGDVSGR